MELREFGWNASLERLFRPHRAESLVPARVVRQSREALVLATEGGEIAARPSGRFRHGASSRLDLPSIGDWVATRPRPAEREGTIQALLPRRNGFVREAAGRRTEAQIVAANLDAVFIVTDLGGDFSLRRIERALVLARDGAVDPVVLLNKADLGGDAGLRARQVKGIAPDIPVHAVSARHGTGLAAVGAHLGPGRTGVLIGSSGVGKSTLVNRLLGEARLPTSAVRARDGRGRHTTTARELHCLPDGAGLLVDTPGLRELGLRADRAALAGGFADVEALAAGCRFRDCGHTGEPGCAIQRALEEGWLDEDRYESYLTQRDEIADLGQRRAVRDRRLRDRRRRRHAVDSRNTRRSLDQGL